MRMFQNRISRNEAHLIKYKYSSANNVFFFLDRNSTKRGNCADNYNNLYLSSSLLTFAHQPTLSLEFRETISKEIACIKLSE